MGSVIQEWSELPVETRRLCSMVSLQGLTHRSLARRAGLSEKTIYNALHGRPVRQDTKRRILKVLGVAFSGHHHYFPKDEG